MPQSPRSCFLESAPSPQRAASAAMPPVRRRSAAEQTSLARYGVRAVDTGNDLQKTRGEATYTALTLRSACSPSSPKPAMCGVKGQDPLPFSGGSKGGILFGKRIPPLNWQWRSAPHYQCSAARCNPPTPLQEGDKKRTLSRIERRSLLLVA